MIPKQVIFKDPDKHVLGGIMVKNGRDTFIICGCCGGVFEYEELGKENVKIIPWINIEEEIRGDENFDPV